MRSIRLASPGDAARIAAIYEPYVTHHATSFELVPPTEDEMRARITSTLERFPWLVLENSGEIAGYAYAGQFAERAAYRWTASVSVYLDERYHRSGGGRALYEALFPILRQQGIVTLMAGITLPNPGSSGLHRAMGFAPAAVFPRVGYKFDRWHDVEWLSMHLASDAAPAEPVPLPELALAGVLPGA